MILIDTSVWSLTFCRHATVLSPAETKLVARTRALMSTGEAVLIGPVRQELLSGVKSSAQFAILQQLIDGFALLNINVSTYDLAATYFNSCRAKGISPGDVDMMVCAVAVENSVPILTRDNDFHRYANVIPIRLA